METNWLDEWAAEQGHVPVVNRAGHKMWAKPPASARIQCEDCWEQISNCSCIDWEDVYE